MPIYADSAAGIRSDQLTGGFFVGWPSPPTAERHLDILRGSDAVVMAIDDDAVVGYATAISDGVLSAFIPLLEVLARISAPRHRHRTRETVAGTTRQALHGRRLLRCRP